MTATLAHHNAPKYIRTWLHCSPKLFLFLCPPAPPAPLRPPCRHCCIARRPSHAQPETYFDDSQHSKHTTPLPSYKLDFRFIQSPGWSRYYVSPMDDLHTETGARTRPAFPMPRTAPAHQPVDTHGRPQNGQTIDTHAAQHDLPVPSYPTYPYAQEGDVAFDIRLQIVGWPDRVIMTSGQKLDRRPPAWPPPARRPSRSPTRCRPTAPARARWGTAP